MGNYDVNALSCVSNTEATVSISGIKVYVHASNPHLAQTFTVNTAKSCSVDSVLKSATMQ